MTDIKHHIRLLKDSATHLAGTILGVTHHHHHAASGHHLVHHTHAHDLVKQGHAEWVGIASAAAPASEGHEDMHHRHREEHADMLSRHAAEHREMVDRHIHEAQSALAQAGIALAVTG